MAVVAALRILVRIVAGGRSRATRAIEGVEGVLGVVLGALGALLERFLGVFLASWGILARHWGCHLGVLGSPRCILGALGLSWVALGGSQVLKP